MRSERRDRTGDGVNERGRRRGGWLLVALLTLAGPSAAGAASYTWTGGGGDGKWSNPANWNGTAPKDNEAGVQLEFPALDAPYAADNDLNGLHVTFLDIATQVGAGDYAFTGKPVNLEGSATLSNPGTGNPNLVWRIPLLLGAQATIASSGRQTRIQADIDLGAHTLTFNTLGDILVTGVISGAGDLRKTNVGALTLGGANTYSGTTTSHIGALYLADAMALGSAGGGTTVKGGNLSFAPGSSFALAEPLVFEGGGILAYGTPSISGPVTVNAAIDVRAFDAPAVLTIDGAVGGSGSITVAGAGVVVMSGTATYAGGTTVSSGTLQLDGFIGGAAGVTVRDGATLRGSGSTAGSCTVESGGTLSPGPGTAVFGCGGLSLASGATLAMEINGPTAGTGYDEIVVNGAVALGGATLSLTLGSVPPNGQSYTLLVLQQGQGVSGTFAGLPNGATFELGGQTFGIAYDESSVVLTAAPGSSTPTPTEGPATATPSPSPTPTATPTGGATCAGDCDGNGAVGINELVLGVNIALGNERVDRCPGFDSNGDGQVGIAELIAAVNNALGGCP
ncbi:autotransporter-associated beta strand repeat-containing protein [bacterium]|nr:autotransporter-associated beta strand repeat-containing protein [bacterium]